MGGLTKLVFNMLRREPFSNLSSFSKSYIIRRTVGSNFMSSSYLCLFLSIDTEIHLEEQNLELQEGAHYSKFK
jgi:hypothetical protein